MPQRERSVAQFAGKTTDGVLVRQALAGDERAFESLVHRYETSVFACICRYLRDYDQACDVLQEVWLQLFRSLPTLHTEAPLGPWLFQVARNRSLDALRKKGRRDILYFSDLEREADEEGQSSLACLPDSHPLPDELAEQHDLQHVIHQAIQALPPEFRTVVLLRSAAQLSFTEIGRVLHKPETTVKSCFHRARPRLAALLTSWHEQDNT
jgi:RNA polymerase sigma factor (sigma-70 family)